ncbi:hypothetical protein SEA_HORTUS1_22 [Microbacterium phage Hortus1]|nr:hypothetical protein SEA_HORTUS1_22 [Microbacterium phage Hortus1]AWY05593.1 hypothetical protein SEA_OLINDD_22 [Microbacterium phage OlinDD]AWY06352.1 hypothetical protein SEA_TANDEM_22 [Microbacterium phage Tandem]QAU07355.2 hypothetical protein SEA_ALLEB_23 [Microbacterium phage Alleb]
MLPTALWDWWGFSFARTCASPSGPATFESSHYEGGSMGKNVNALRLSIQVLDENDEVIEKRGGRYDIVNPAGYSREEIVDAMVGTTRRTIEHILKEGIR